MRIRTLLYHDVVDDGRWASSGFDSGDAAVYKLTRRAFDAHLEALASLRLPPDLAGGTPRSRWMLTFDDGGASAIAAIAPALEARGWRGHFFMTTGRLGAPGFLDADALRELAARGHVIGSHSRTHPLAMASLSRTELRQEWTESADTLAEVLGTRPTVASIPGGAYSAAVAAAAGEAGIRTLFTSEPREEPWAVGAVVCLGRYVVRRGTTPAAALQLAEGRGTGRFRQRILWDAKKLVKLACGPAYRDFRRWMLADRGSINGARETGRPPPR